MAYITLLSDLGLQDASVAAAKGIIMQHCKRSIVDISHEISPFELKQAAYLFSSVYAKYPTGTCHILLFDVFSEPNPKLLLTSCNGHFFLCADNGILPLALSVPLSNTGLAMELQSHHTFADWVATAARIVEALDTGGKLSLKPHALKTIAAPQGEQAQITCNIIHVDRFENVVLNINKSQLEEMGGGRNFRIEFVQVEEIDELSHHYNDVRAGYKLSRFNSTGNLEICINRGKAASLFGLGPDNKHNDIKITFE